MKCYFFSYIFMMKIEALFQHPGDMPVVLGICFMKDHTSAYTTTVLRLAQHKCFDWLWARAQQKGFDSLRLRSGNTLIYVLQILSLREGARASLREVPIEPSPRGPRSRGSPRMDPRRLA